MPCAFQSLLLLACEHKTGRLSIVFSIYGSIYSLSWY